MTVASITRNLGKFATDNSPTILTAFGVGGLLSTVVLAVRATPQVMRNIDAVDINHERPPTVIEKIRVSWRAYLPAVVVGGVTIVCIIKANSINTRRNAAVIGLYTLTENAFHEYKAKVVETIGSTKEDKVRAELAQDRVRQYPPGESSTVMIVGTDVLCFDTFTGRYFQSNAEAIRKAQNDINLQCINDMYASHNDFYRAVGLPPVDVGEEVGWTTSNTMEIKFSTVLTEDNRPCMSLEYRVAPIRNFHKIW